MKAIIAVNNLGFIGLNGGLPWDKCPADLKHFKKLTDGCHLIVGYNTFKTLPPLPNRATWVDREGELEAIEANPERHKDVWIIGGKKTYEKYCHLFDEIHISYIDDNSRGDTMFPDLRNLKDGCEVFKYYF